MKRESISHRHAKRAPSLWWLLVTVALLGAAYPVTADSVLDEEAVKLTASDAEDSDYFGWSVAVSGDLVVVGAAVEDGAGSNRGAAYVYERNEGGSGNWGEVAKLTASDAADSDWFGLSVGISGDTLVVGAPYQAGEGSYRGAAYVYERNEGGAENWGEVTKLTASDSADDDSFGWSVGIDGDTVVVGAPYEAGEGSYRGAAYVYERNQGGEDHWGEVTKLAASDATDDDYFGLSVAVSGDTVVAGAPGDYPGGIDPGAAYVYGRNAGGADNWGEVTKLTASDAEESDWLGFSVGISGDTVVVGAWGEAGDGSDRGAAYVYEQNQGGVDNWGEVTKLTASDAADGDYFGWSVGISADMVTVGAYREDGAGSLRGAAYVYERNQEGANSWGEMTKLAASDTADNDYFGGSVGINGGTVIVGARGEDGDGSDRGASYVFDLELPKTYLYLPIVLSSGS